MANFEEPISSQDVWDGKLMMNGMLPDEEAEPTKPVAMTIGDKEVREALATLTQYKNDKRSLEARIVENELWYKARHWTAMRRKYREGEKAKEIRPEPTSAWLFNVIMNKHADAMDNIPTLNVLPREQGDEYDAESLSNIIPVVLERNDWEQVYSDEQWYKLKHGTGVFGVFWDNKAENGLGDITVKQIDLLNIFWESGITDIQRSRNLFIVNLVDNDILKARYPQLKDNPGQTINIQKYVYDDDVDTSDKSLVVDWYYKKSVGTKTVLHYAKIVGDELVFATENDPNFAETGWYAHGKYPVVFDILFPTESTPTGFGFVDIMKSPQMYIDKIDQIVLENTLRAGKTRYFVKADGGVNLNDFADLSKELIEINANDISDAVQKVDNGEIDLGILNYVQYKVQEMKETSGNTDVSNGVSSSGVTAAAAISALQESGNKGSRDIINGGYRAFQRVGYQVIELIRQFYDVQRSFRIEGQGGVARYISYSNELINGQRMMLPDGTMSSRKPVFDIKVSAQRKNPFSTLSQNELAMNLYSAGVFNPEMAQQSLIMLDMMEFEGKDKLIAKVQQNYQMFMMQQQIAMQQMMIGAPVVEDGSQPMPKGEAQSSSIPKDNGIAGAVQNAQTPYAQKLQERRRAQVSE